MPAIGELTTLIKTGRSPSIDSVWFPNTPTSNVWSNSPVIGFASAAFGVTFATGELEVAFRFAGINYGSLRLVRDGQSLAPLGVPACTVSADKSSVGANESITLTANCTNSPASYVWSANSNCSGTSNTCTVTPSATTSYTVKGVNASGTGGVSQPFTVSSCTFILENPLRPLMTVPTEVEGDGWAEFGKKITVTPTSSSSPSCAWKATSTHITAPWLHLTNDTGTGSGELNFTVDQYAKTSRSDPDTRMGTIVVNGSPWQVIQKALTDTDGDGVWDEWEKRGVMR
jgi:hypothetical protein